MATSVLSNDAQIEGGELRTPPHDHGAEQVVLGAMMASADAAAEIEHIVRGADFYRPAHGVLFDAIVAQHARKEPADPIALAEALHRAGNLTKVGGGPYLHTCMSRVPVAAQGPYYARIVREKADLRRLAELATFIGQSVYGPSPRPAGELGDAIRERLAGLDDTPGSGPGLRPWKKIVPDVFEEIDKAADPDSTDAEVVIPTGFIDLNRLLDGGFRAPQFIVVAARTGVGKSVVTTGFAAHAAFRHNLPSAIFSLEMFDTQVGKRILAAESRVPLYLLKSGQLDDQDWVRLARAMGETADAPLFIDSSPTITLADIRARCRRLKRQHGLALVVVDYLQLVETTRAENRQQAVATVSRGLKLLAMELQVVVIGVSQLNRGPEQRVDKRPQLSDLRESGAIENDADTVILLHRDDYYDKESPRAGEADFIVAKSRDGGTDTVTVAAQLHLSRFVDMAIEAA